MDNQTILRQTVAEFFQIAPEQVTSSLDFRGRMSGSLARARFDVALRQRLKIVCREVYTAKTYGELEAAVLGKPIDVIDHAAPSASLNGSGAAPAIAAASPLADMENIACGIDIESPEQLPLEDDYWESEFYRANFSRAEIAYCASQAEPRQHFAARWCAKESLKKCDAQYMSMEMNRIEVVLDATGRPTLHSRSAEGDNSSPLQVAVSLTHVGALAAAVVVKVKVATPPTNESRNANRSTGSQNTTLALRSETPTRRGWWNRLFG